MTPLGEEIARLIREEGPLPVSRYMQLALGHPRHGYYVTRDPFGARGDFVTAPEISQMFGELIGFWGLQAWLFMGSPPAFRLVELGPGRGTLMADMLRATRIVPGFREAATIHLVETSPVLRAAQERVLEGVDVRWHGEVEAALDGPCIVIANEFLDALPVDQFVMTAEGWRERLVGLGESGDLVWGLAAEGPSSDPALPGHLLPRGQKDGASPGDMFEHPAVALAVAGAVSRHLASQGGAGLFIDYGPVRSGFGDSLQAVKAHGFADPLAEPGEADLTVHVDFARMAAAARAAGAAVQGPAEQGAFLRALGLDQRAARLSARATPAQAGAIAAAVARLTEGGATGMGSLFKALALRHPALPPLPGFDPGPG